MIGAIKRFAQIERAHIDCGAIRNIPLCHVTRLTVKSHLGNPDAS